MAQFKKGEIVRCNTSSDGKEWVPAVVSEVVEHEPAQYFVTVFAGRFVDPAAPGGGISGAASQVGPLGEGVERYGLSPL